MENDPEDVDVYLEETGKKSVSRSAEDLKIRQEEPRTDWVGKASSYVPARAIKLALRLQTNQRAFARHSFLGQSGPLPKAKKDRKITPVFASSTELVNRTLNEAKQLLARNRPDDAIEVLKTRLRDGLLHADLYYLLGEALRTQDRYEEAEESLLGCLSMKLHSPFAYYSLGLVYLEQGRLDAAVPLLLHFLAQIVFRMQDKAEGHYHLGRALVACGNFIEAAVHFTRAMELTAPHEVESICSVLILRADAYEAAGRPDLSVQDFREVRRLSPHFHEPYVQYASELEEAGQHADALTLRAFIGKLFK